MTHAKLVRYTTAGALVTLLAGAVAEAEGIHHVEHQEPEAPLVTRVAVYFSTANEIHKMKSDSYRVPITPMGTKMDLT